MLGRTHEVGGVSALLLTNIAMPTIHVNTPTAVFTVLAVLIGSLSPDLDKPTSIIYQKIPAGSFFGWLIHPLFIGGHRHLSHSLIGFAIFAHLSHYLIFRYLNPFSLSLFYIWIAYLIGVASHFLLDALTTEGIPLLFPLPLAFGIPPIKSLRIKTGGLIEHFVFLPLLVIITLYIVCSYYHLVRF